MFIEKPDHKVFTQIILCLYSYVFNILPGSDLIVVVIQITNQCLVSSPREIGRYTNIANDTSAIGNAFKIGSKAHIFDDESKFEGVANGGRSEEHTSELQSRPHLVCRLLLEKKKKK